MNYIILKDNSSGLEPFPEVGLNAISQGELEKCVVELVDQIVGEPESLSYDYSTFERFDKDAIGSPLDNIIILGVLNQIDGVPSSGWVLQKVIDRNENRRQNVTRFISN